MIKISKKRIIHLLTILVLLFSYSGLWAQTCESMPEPVAYTQVSSTTSKVVEYATIRGVRVTRTMTTRGNNGDQIMYSNQDYTPTETSLCWGIILIGIHNLIPIVTSCCHCTCNSNSSNSSILNYF